jgi:hypothetical protein
MNLKLTTRHLQPSYPLWLLIALPFLLACEYSKITFDLSQIDESGLIGTGSGKHSLSYEFCIPRGQKFLEEVLAIAPEVQHYTSPGRIGCRKEQYLCIGNTHNPQWREILLQLANLSYIERINQTFWE